MLDPVCSLDRDTSASLSHALTGHKTQHFHFTLRCYVWEMLIHSVPETELELICSSLLACVRGRMQCGGRGDLGASAFCTFPQTQAQGTQARAAVPLDSSVTWLPLLLPDPEEQCPSQTFFRESSGGARMHILELVEGSLNFLICKRNTMQSPSVKTASALRTDDQDYRLPRWCGGKEFAWQCRRCRRLQFNPRVGKLPWRRAWRPTLVFLSEKIPWTGEPGRLVHGVTKSQTLQSN